MQLTKHWAATLDDYAIDLAWSPDGTQLAAASAAGPVSLFAAADGAQRHDLPGHTSGTNCLAWAAAPLLASGGQDGAVKFWDAAADQHTATATLGSAWIEHLACRPGGNTFAASAGRKLCLLHPDGSVLHTFKDAAKTITALAFEPQGGCVAAAHFGGVQLWDADDFLLQKEFPYANGIHALIWSPDG